MMSVIDSVQPVLTALAGALETAPEKSAGATAREVVELASKGLDAIKLGTSVVTDGAKLLRELHVLGPKDTRPPVDRYAANAGARQDVYEKLSAFNDRLLGNRPA